MSNLGPIQIEADWIELEKYFIFLCVLDYFLKDVLVPLIAQNQASGHFHRVIDLFPAVIGRDLSKESSVLRL